MGSPVRSAASSTMKLCVDPESRSAAHERPDLHGVAAGDSGDRVEGEVRGLILSERLISSNTVLGVVLGGDVEEEEPLADAVVPGGYADTFHLKKFK
jgi:hypothetical protein